MHFRPLGPVIPGVMAAGLLSAACSSTSTRQPLAGHTAASATAKPSRIRLSGTVHLTDYTANDGPASTVILPGAVGDYGRAQSVNADGSVDPQPAHQLNLMLARGSFRLDIADLDLKFVAVLAGLAVNATTCSVTASVSERPRR